MQLSVFLCTRYSCRVLYKIEKLHAPVVSIGNKVLTSFLCDTKHYCILTVERIEKQKKEKHMQYTGLFPGIFICLFVYEVNTAKQQQKRSFLKKKLKLAMKA